MNETFTDEFVTYTFEVEGRFVAVENVPARVCRETGERLFTPDTVEHVYQLVWANNLPPKRIVQTPVYEYG